MLVSKLNEAGFRHKIAQEDTDIIIVITAINEPKINRDSEF